MSGNSWIRQALLALALLALGARVAAPPGYMFSASDVGQLTITLCGGDHVDLPLSDPAHHQSLPGSDGHCVFAGAATAAPAATAPSLAAPAFTFVLASARVEHARIGKGLAAPPPPSTGPPLFS